MSQLTYLVKSVRSVVWGCLGGPIYCIGYLIGLVASPFLVGFLEGTSTGSDITRKELLE